MVLLFVFVSSAREFVLLSNVYYFRLVEVTTINVETFDFCVVVSRPFRYIFVVDYFNLHLPARIRRKVSRSK